MFCFRKSRINENGGKQNLTRAVFAVAFKSIFASAVVRSFGVATCGILVTLVFNRAFVNVWSMNKVSFLDSKFATLMSVVGWKVMAEILSAPAGRIWPYFREKS